ncbi:MAG: D-2-hydroxyacid dehydrogenase [Limnochordales bacterium]|nr:MAG: D-2-hydroxyacid dehydrogenase [Bacillota bacterium]
MNEAAPLTVLIYYQNEKRAEEVRSLVARRFPQLTVRAVSARGDAEALVEEADVIAGWGFPTDLLARARRLRWFHKFAAGVDDVVAAGTLPPQAVLTRTDGRVFGRRMAEYVIAYMLAHSQNVPRILRQQAERRWKPFLTTTLAGRTVGIAGLGDIGQEIVRRAAALDMRVLGWRRSAGDVPGVERMYAGREEFHEFLGQCDYVVVVLPLTDATRGLFDDTAFAAMRDGTYLINVGRGPVIQEQALLRALESGKLAGATLDVFDVEPLPEDHPFWRMENVIVTPHMSGPTVAEEVTAPFIENMERFLAGRPLLKQVDLQRGY